MNTSFNWQCVNNLRSNKNVPCPVGRRWRRHHPALTLLIWTWIAVNWPWIHTRIIFFNLRIISETCFSLMNTSFNWQCVKNLRSLMSSAINKQCANNSRSNNKNLILEQYSCYGLSNDIHSSYCHSNIAHIQGSQNQNWWATLWDSLSIEGSWTTGICVLDISHSLISIPIWHHLRQCPYGMTSSSAYPYSSITDFFLILDETPYLTVQCTMPRCIEVQEDLHQVPCV